VSLYDPIWASTRLVLSDLYPASQNNEPHYRHVPHLYSLYPGHDISLKVTLELAAAVKKSLELRGDGESGWSTMWRRSFGTRAS